MPDNPSVDTRLDLLTQKYLEGEITSEEASELLERIERDPNQGHALLEQLWIHEKLRETASSERVKPIAHGLSGPKQQWVGWMIAASVIVFATLAIFINRNPTPAPSAGQQRALPEKPNKPPLAIFSAESNASWDNTAPALGSTQVAQRMVLNEGFARMDFLNGAQILISGPCDFELVSMDRVYCHSGRIAIDVPTQARGFIIESPAGIIRDLGTSFGVEVMNGQTALHVFDGEVEVVCSYPEIVKAGDAVTLIEGRVVEKFDAKRSLFITPTEFTSEQLVELKRQEQIWREAGTQWNKDPDLLARYTFESLEAAAVQVPNLSEISKVQNGVLVVPDTGKGRWPGKVSPNFNRQSDRVRIDVPGEYESLTLTAWVAVRDLRNSYHSLLMSDGFGEGALHWQLLEDGAMRLTTNPPDDYYTIYEAKEIVMPDSLGRWIHLATVVDYDAKQVRHYLNGHEVMSLDAPKLHPLRIGKACIGNWSKPVGGVPVRNFNGRIDELTIHSRALKAAEIREMHVIGSPNSH